MNEVKTLWIPVARDEVFQLHKSPFEMMETAAKRELAKRYPEGSKFIGVTNSRQLDDGSMEVTFTALVPA